MPLYAIVNVYVWTAQSVCLLSPMLFDPTANVRRVVSRPPFGPTWPNTLNPLSNASMPGTRRIIGTINHRWHDTSFERSYLFNFLDRHVVRFFPASLAVFLSPQLGNGNENCAICLEALVVGVEDIWCSLVSPSPIIIRSSTCSVILCTPP